MPKTRLSTCEIFKVNLRRRIEDLGFCNQQVSLRIGQNRDYVQHIMNGEAMLTCLRSDTLDKISWAVGVPPWVMISPDADVSEKTWPSPEHLRDY